MSGPGRGEADGALRRLVTACAGVRAGERCLIVTDTGADAGIAEALAATLRAFDAPVRLVRAEPAALPGADLAPAVGAAMVGADVIFELTSVFAGAGAARREACARGARYLTVPGLTWTTLRPGGPLFADFMALGERARRLARAFDDAAEFHLTSPQGTDLRGSFAGRAGRPLWGVADEAGGYAAPPDVEVGAAPVEETSEGTVVIDGSVLFLGPDQLAAPITLRVRDGVLEDAAGPDAWRLLDALERADDPRMSTLAEVSIGLNPLARPGGSPLELEGIAGGAHVAFGNNVPYGGAVDAPSHIDCVLLDARLSLDGVALDPRG
jgi:hypothetical protein